MQIAAGRRSLIIMKKGFALLLICIFAISSCITNVCAADSFTVALNEEATQLSISGTSELAPGTAVAITISKPGKDLTGAPSGSLDDYALLIDETALASNGSYTYVYNLPEDMISGRYLVRVKVYGEAEVNENIDYTNITARNQAVADMNAGIAAKTVLDKYAVDIDVDTGIKYNSYKNEKQIVAYHVTEAKTSSEWTAETLAAAFTAGVNKVEAFKTLKTLERPDAREFLEENWDTLAIPETTVLRYNALREAKKQLTIVKLVNGLKDVDSPAELDEFIQDCIEEALKTQNSGSDNGGGGGGGLGGSTPNRVTSGVGAVTSPSATGTTNTGNAYKDLEYYKWAQEAINELSAAGIVNGKAEGLFYPADTLTREEAVKIIVLGFGLTQKDNSAFTDVKDGAWYKEYIDIAVKCGVINGMGDGSFGVGIPVSRQDMMVMLSRAAAYANYKVYSIRQMNFFDEAIIADYAKEAVKTMANAGIISGRGDGHFDPIANATRAEAAQMCYNLFYKLSLI